MVKRTAFMTEINKTDGKGCRSAWRNRFAWQSFSACAEICFIITGNRLGVNGQDENVIFDILLISSPQYRSHEHIPHHSHCHKTK